MIGSCQTIAVDAEHHQQVGVRGVPSPRPHEHGDEREHHDDRPDLMQNEPVVPSEQELHRTRDARHLRVGDARGDGARARVVGDHRRARRRRPRSTPRPPVTASVRRPDVPTVARPWCIALAIASVLTEAIDEMRVDAVGIEPPGHEVAGAHPGSVGPLPETRAWSRVRRTRREASSPARAPPSRRAGSTDARRRTRGAARWRCRGSPPVRSTAGAARRPPRTGRGSAGRRGWPRRTGRSRSIPGSRSTARG